MVLVFLWAHLLSYEYTRKKINRATSELKREDKMKHTKSIQVWKLKPTAGSTTLFSFSLFSAMNSVFLFAALKLYLVNRVQKEQNHELCNQIASTCVWLVFGFSVFVSFILLISFSRKLIGWQTISFESYFYF